MANIELSKRQLSYVILALNKYEAELLDSEEEDMGDEVDDLLMVQDLKTIFKREKESS
jgi:hypothetical protein